MFLILLATLFQPALAKPNGDMECSAPYVLFASPSMGQTEVPVDVQPAVFMSNDHCSAPSYYELVLSTGDVVVKSVQVDWDPSGERLFELPLDNELDPGTDYELSVIAGDGWGEMTALHFSTVGATVVGLQGEPEVNVLTAELDESSAIVRASYDILPADDTDELSILMVYNEANPSQLVQAYRVGESTENNLEYASIVEPPFPTEVCLSVVQRDGTGQRTERSAPSCGSTERVPLDMHRCCSVVSAAGFTWFMPLLALAAIRRRD